VIIRVKLFAVTRDLAGTDEVHLELPETATVADLQAKLVRAHPALESVLDHVMFAVDSQYADLNRTLSDGSEVALIPPVSGG